MSEWTSIAQPMHYIVELDAPLTVRRERGVLVQGDENANAFVLAIYQHKGVPADLTGCTVTLTFLRPDNLVVPPIAAAIDGNVATTTLTAACYRVSGMYGVLVTLAKDGAERTILKTIGDVISTENSGMVDEEGVFPTPEELLAALEQVETARQNANTAAENANANAAAANAAAGSANSAAAAATDAANAANAAAEALGNAPVPTGTVVNYQVGTSATTPPTGAWLENPPTVPQGEYLWTRTVQSFTNGDPVTGYSVARQGVDGSGSVSSVNNVAPDTSGNVQLTPDTVGALPAGGTAADSSKLGGKAPEYYLSPRNLLDNSDFRNPVNQRGFTGSLSGDNVYFIDRWKTNQQYTENINIELTNDGLKVTLLNGVVGILQNIPTPSSEVTLAAKIDETVYTYCVAVGVNDDLNLQNGCVLSLYWGEEYTAVKIMGTSEEIESFTLEWAALYEGEYTAETLPPYVPKGYAAELAECRRYYRKQPALPLPAVCFYSNSLTVIGLDRAPMRIVPSVTIGKIASVDQIVTYTPGNLVADECGLVWIGVNESISPGQYVYVWGIEEHADL